MTVSKNARPTQAYGNESFGLSASGASGGWEVAIDESTSGEDRWFAQIEGPSVSFYFEIPSVEIVGKMLCSLESSPETANVVSNGSGERNSSLTLGQDKTVPVTLVRDDEYPDRFFLLVGSTDRPLVRFAIVGTDVADLAESLRQVKVDLSDET